MPKARADVEARHGADDDDHTAVIVVGAGPTGLMLAGELRLGGADVLVLERRTAPHAESRASTLHARSMEILDSRGLLASLGAPPNVPVGHFGGIPLDLSTPSRFAGQWKVPQTRLEAELQAWAIRSGAEVRRGWELVDLVDIGEGVRASVRAPDGSLRTLRAGFLVACDGQDSTVRRLTGVPFPGRPARRELLLADVAGIDLRARRFERLDHGLAVAARNSDGSTRVMVHEFGRVPEPRTGPPGFAEVSDAWQRVTGEDISVGDPRWVHFFDDANHQVERYRHGSVLFAGDAAHRKLPSGGQALNLGLQDAVNLGWKLAAVVRGDAPVELLDTYHVERHAVGARVLANIRAQTLLLLGAGEVEPARALLAELIAAEPTRARLAGMISGLDVRYPMTGGEHAWLGLRLPDLTVRTRAGRTTTTSTLLRSGRGLLLDLGAEDLARCAARWPDRVDAVVATLPAPGPAGSSAVLVRPDGHVAWAGRDDTGLLASLRRWFGEPADAPPETQ